MKNYFLQFLCVLVFSQLISLPTKAQTASATDNIIVTNNASDVSGLMKVGDANISKEGLILSTRDKLYKKAEDELRKKASALGANVIYLKVNEFTQQPLFTVHVVAEFYKSPSATDGQRVGQSAENIVTNINSGLDFTVTGCTGDVNSQTVTVYFSFSNPRKAHQRIGVFNDMQRHSKAFDTDGNQFPCKNFTLGNESNYDIETELPTGLRVKGTATFSNVLSTSTKLAVIEIATINSNWDGGGDRREGTIEIKNVPIIWNGKPATSAVGDEPTQNDYISYDQLAGKLNRGEKATNAKVILNNIYFDTNAATLTEASKSHLGNIMLLLAKYPHIKATFTGNTDNVGRDDDNLNLSTQRAKSVVDYMVSRGISRDRLFYQGLGSSKPIADNSTEEGRAKNRRTEMQIISQ
ncbi:MAG: OmpA family protein [Sphingobacteriales bacterium]